jgi:predicted DNA binding CopG/RHH family protein
MKKKISFKTLDQMKQSTEGKDTNFDSQLDAWVSSNRGIHSMEKLDSKITDAKQLPLIKESRFTVVIPDYLHKRIKKYCAVNGIPMKEKITEIFEKEFPET